MTGHAPADELQQLRRCLRDLVALTALPATWTGKAPDEIAALAADVLLATLRLDAVFILLEGMQATPSVRLRLSGQQNIGAPAEEVSRLFVGYVQTAALNTPASIPALQGQGSVRAIVLPIGHQRQFGCVLAASHLPHFPDEYERLLLEVCVNQTATALKEAHLVAELRESNAALRRSNDDLAQYAYAASHDLQEPLRTIVVYTQILDRRYRDQLDSSAEETISRVISSARRMEQLIRDLLSHSRLSSATEETAAPVETAHVVRMALEDLHEAVAETGASVTTGPLPLVLGDASQLRELFQNLIGNAVKYRRSGEPPCIHIHAEQDGPEWRFTVRDNGQGFDPKYADQIFRVFTRLHGKEVPGTGMGLAICKKIVERHGGRIWAESSAGNGAAFHFTLPNAPG